ncbi:MAG: bifunctional DNA-formamidopyrimidine glycosylase/DNA-(apurinic or apyrimidinic site) lyase [Rickettsiales bacterium]|nr:bifunctional DNA-formamidopyrimidine glycosylase/DNA-(apurinic or apyrimidinic site) lyase [Rickettsiales bacterium]MCA0254909.1 bifunctional DNA-formamidopyrimidine glycosylase/DNA-(apurinic or apyrimidinic site) lyase [Pseudomonadota bacterium]
MPELAEVETVKDYLLKNIIGRKITKYVQRRNNLRYKLPNDFDNYLINATIISVSRRAKYLYLHLDNAYILVFHLGMTGRLTTQDSQYLYKKHDHIIIDFDDGTKLVFNDTRRFGMVYISHKDQITHQPYIRDLGIEPLGTEFDSEFLSQRLANKKTSIKQALMDNKIVVGVGNIYASESLFLAKINPIKQSKNLSAKELNAIVSSIKYVLEKAIKAGGTTLKDFVNGDNKPGYFQQKLKVYGRKGKECFVCGEKIIMLKQSGRATFYCPNCQK